MTGATREPDGAQSIGRAAAIINLVASYNSEGLRAVDVAESLNLSRPTTHRIIQCLVEQGWLMRAKDSKRYLLGHGLFELGLTAAPQFKFREICQPALDRIARKTGHVAFLTIRSGRDAISIARSKGKPLEHQALQIGIHRPLGIGAGSLALLMCLDDQEAEQIVSSNAKRLRNFAEVNTKTLLEIVRICRRDGFAHHDERLLQGVSGVALPLIDNDGQIPGAISISALATQLSHEELQEIVGRLRREVMNVQRLLTNDVGYAAEKVRALSGM